MLARNYVCQWSKLDFSVDCKISLDTVHSRPELNRGGFSPRMNSFEPISLVITFATTAEIKIGFHCWKTTLINYLFKFINPFLKVR